MFAHNGARTRPDSRETATSNCPLWEERKEILEALGLSVVRVDDADNTVCEALTRVRPDYFGNGGDRTTSNPYEHEVCVRLGITEVFGLGGGKAQSSSDLLGNFIHNWNNM